MNPSNNEAQGLNLPPPIIEQGPNVGGETGIIPAEQGRPAAPERGPAAGAAPAAMPVNIPLPTIPSIPLVGQQGAPAPSASAGLQASDDNDLIEKEWVNKAKQIVEHTRDDPYKQSEELTLVKVDYMKKRYNKTLKLNK